MSGSHANPSENPLEVHGSETTPRVESLAADQLVNADPPEPSVNDEAIGRSRLKIPRNNFIASFLLHSNPCTLCILT